MSADLLLHRPVPTWETAWSAALAVLELDVAQAEAQLAAAHTSAPVLTSPRAWAPPVGLGPLPASLKTRAEALLDRQISVGRRIAEAANLSRRQAAAAEGMRSRPPAVPVYLDTEG
ncbi:hypothetical protein DDP54_10640 [Cellulomonas sp. WB94]|uniref:hypothetical protein n=1 Tax=Cellulomonas sp. WB94 TaxID=2173174 RepID=UPI000D570BAF|nr:hypothetical protein [Cellulomonas sp. WB94]PVU84182.1 hypothetical protein DDP54_10640 [Cellulomonas sp. WB94]